MVENSLSLSAATLAQKSETFDYTVHVLENTTHNVNIWFVKTLSIQKKSGSKCCMYKQYFRLNKREPKFILFYNVWNLLDCRSSDHNLSLYTVVGSNECKRTEKKCHGECTQCNSFSIKSRQRHSLGVGSFNHSKNLQVHSTQCPFKQNCDSRYLFNCAVGIHWPLSTCLKWKYGKHIHIQWYGSTIGLMVLLLFSGDEDLTFVWSLLS